MAITRTVIGLKLNVSLENDMEESMGSQTISDCHKDATLDNYLAVGQAIVTLTGATQGTFKKVTTETLIEE